MDQHSCHDRRNLREQHLYLRQTEPAEPVAAELIAHVVVSVQVVPDVSEPAKPGYL